MNYLAHFYLARSDEGLIVGNMLADFVVGRKFRKYPAAIQNGIVLHRKIDEFTDNHPEVEKTKVRLRAKYRKYSPVISDVFYDYILGTNWEDYERMPLKKFSVQIYDTLFRYASHLPYQAQLTLGYMSRNDWLYHYSTYYGIEKALQGLSRRATFKSNMHQAIEDLKRDENEIESEFRTFFEALREFVNAEINESTGQ